MIYISLQVVVIVSKATKAHQKLFFAPKIGVILANFDQN